MTLRNGEPCEHPGCLSHISHPCEGCGRIGGRFPDGYDAKLWEDDAPTYGGITRNGTYTTPGLRANWTPSDAGNLTLEKLQEMFAQVKQFQPDKAMPPYYRAHPATYENMTKYLCNRPERSGWIPDWINFSGVQIVPDPEVPLGEFWPPEGWKADA